MPAVKTYVCFVCHFFTDVASYVLGRLVVELAQVHVAKAPCLLDEVAFRTTPGFAFSELCRSETTVGEPEHG